MHDMQGMRCARSELRAERADTIFKNFNILIGGMADSNVRPSACGCGVHP